MRSVVLGLTTSFLKKKLNVFGDQVKKTIYILIFLNNFLSKLVFLIL